MQAFQREGSGRVIKNSEVALQCYQDSRRLDWMMLFIQRSGAKQVSLKSLFEFPEKRGDSSVAFYGSDKQAVRLNAPGNVV